MVRRCSLNRSFKRRFVNIVTSYHVISLFFHLILIFSLNCQLFLLISGYYTTCNIKITYQCKIIIVPEEGWFGQPKYSTPSKKSFYVVSTSASIFLILFVKPIRSLLIQRTPAGSSFRLFALTFYGPYKMAADNRNVANLHI